MKYQKRVCLKTIAYELGISVNTVSRALRDCDDISEHTKEKVRKMAIELGYLPNNLLYSINNGETKSVALIINNVKNYYFSIMNDRLLYYLREEGYLANIICLYGNAFNTSIVKECIYQRVDMIVTFVEPTKEALELVHINHLPLIMCGRKISKKYCDTLYTDDLKGGALAADYLLRKGAETFIYLHVDGSECSVRRYLGFKRRLAEEKDEFTLKKIRAEDFDSKIEEIRSYPSLGIFAYNDEHLFILLDKLKQRRFDLSQIHFIGYDGVCKNMSGTIKIPSIAFDYDAMAHEVVKLIKDKKDENEKHKSMCFDVYLEDIE
jgi:LacI family transcriptional regulator